MAQYQSFPGSPGDSLTLDKLKRLSLPEMAGRSFLDVGCNEGFFCGFASFQGASRSVGIDQSAGFIERARRRFPDCEFHARGWDMLPEGPFDIILLASALHYADDQEALLHRLVELLSEDGVLVVELGIVTSKKSEWVKVDRGSDQRHFPTMPKLREILAGYAWKWMGPSVSQSGDPVTRHVLHISPRRRAAYLLMQPPAYGKSSIARSLFPGAGVPVVSGDLIIGKIAAGKLKAPEALELAINEGYSPFRIDKAIARIFERGLGPDLIGMWVAQAGTGDFALDMYVPAAYQDTVKQMLEKAGYLPVVLTWQRPGADLMPERVLQERAEAFYLSLLDPPSERVENQPRGMVGFVDEVRISGGRLTVRGWAADADGNMPPSLTIRVPNAVYVVDTYEKQLRPDVQKHMRLPHALVGYRADIVLDGIKTIAQLGRGFAIHAGDAASPGDAFRLAQPLAARLHQDRASG